MAQIFHRSFNVVSRVTIFGTLFLLIGAGWVVGRIVRSPYVTGVDVAIEQPVQFSHAHHVGRLGIDCRYCHTSVETSGFAGMPSTKTCMNCHSQVWSGSEALFPIRESLRSGRPLQWNRVYDLPDFTYFDHSIHVVKGIGCVTCHGRIDQMPLTVKANALHMEWCLDCHRDPAKYVRPRDEVFNLAYEPPRDREFGRRLVEEYRIRRLTSCSTCHR